MANQNNSISSSGDILQKLRTACDENSEVSFNIVMDAIGRRSFGPIILAVGAFLVIPGLSDIPTVTSIFGLLVIVIGAQILIGREHIWLPKWLLQRQANSKKVQKVLDWLEKPASITDKLIKPRMQYLTTGIGGKISTITCIAIALLAPLMEFIPFSANIAGVAFIFFGLGLVGKDGLMNIFGFIFCGVLVLIGLHFLL